MENSKKQSHHFIPAFRKAFLSPRYWGVWLAVTVCAGVALLPVSLRDPLLAVVGRTAGRFAVSARRRARINLFYCMPELSVPQREEIIDRMFATAAQSMAVVAELALKRSTCVSRRIVWHGREVMDALTASQQKVIFLVPHGWAIDIPAMLMAFEGLKIAGMFHHQRNPLINYIWNVVRLRYGGRLHAREDGIKPFISSVRQGYWGYYLPDEDHGPEQSRFVDFFATYKATLPALGRLMKVCQAKVVPLFPVYDGKTHQLHLHIHPPMDDLSEVDETTLARRMNEEVEKFVRPNPEQYTWILKLLKTRKDGETEPYQREDL